MTFLATMVKPNTSLKLNSNIVRLLSSKLNGGIGSGTAVPD